MTDSNESTKHDLRQRARALVVDDDSDVREVAAESLARAGFDVQVAGGVHNAYKCLQPDAFDGVVLDINMKDGQPDPRRAGFQILEVIADMYRRPAVVVLTAYATAREDILEALECHADAFLSKLGEDGGEVWVRRLPKLLETVVGCRQNAYKEQEELLYFDHRQARQLQKAGLPKKLVRVPNEPRLTTAGGNIPSLLVSGDTYTAFYVTHSSKLAFMLCDAMGHGARAALAAMQLRTVFRIGVQRGWEFKDIDQEMHRSLSLEDPLGEGDSDDSFLMMATGLAGVLDIKARRIELLVAGHDMPSVVGVSGEEVVLPEVRGEQWGQPGERSPAICDFEFGPGQSAVLFSDGLTNAVDGAYGVLGVKRAHLGADGVNAVELRDHVLHDVVKFADYRAPHNDDLTILALHWAAK